MYPTQISLYVPSLCTQLKSPSYIQLKSPSVFLPRVHNSNLPMCSSILYTTQISLSSSLMYTTRISLCVPPSCSQLKSPSVFLLRVHNYDLVDIEWSHTSFSFKPLTFLQTICRSIFYLNLSQIVFDLKVIDELFNTVNVMNEAVIVINWKTI